MANPNPPPPPVEHQFKKGQSGNPGGRTSEQRKMEVANAEAATRIRAALLAKMAAHIDPITGTFTDEMNSELLKLIKDSEDRGLGTPTNKQAFTDSEGNDIPASLTLQVVRPPSP